MIGTSYQWLRPPFLLFVPGDIAGRFALVYQFPMWTFYQLIWKMEAWY